MFLLNSCHFTNVCGVCGVCACGVYGVCVCVCVCVRVCVCVGAYVHKFVHACAIVRSLNLVAPGPVNSVTKLEGIEAPRAQSVQQFTSSILCLRHGSVSQLKISNYHTLTALFVYSVIYTICILP